MDSRGAGKGRRPGDRAAHRQDHRGSESAAVSGRFAHHHGATVTITLKDGRRFSDHVDFPRGSAPRGIEWADVDAKYRRLVPLSGLTQEKVEASLAVVHRLDAVKTVSELTRLLR